MPRVPAPPRTPSPRQRGSPPDSSFANAIPVDKTAAAAVITNNDMTPNRGLRFTSAYRNAVRRTASASRMAARLARNGVAIAPHSGSAPDLTRAAAAYEAAPALSGGNSAVQESIRRQLQPAPNASPTAAAIAAAASFSLTYSGRGEGGAADTECGSEARTPPGPGFGVLDVSQVSSNAEQGHFEYDDDGGGDGENDATLMEMNYVETDGRNSSGDDERGGERKQGVGAPDGGGAVRPPVGLACGVTRSPYMLDYSYAVFRQRRSMEGLPQPKSKTREEPRVRTSGRIE